MKKLRKLKQGVALDGFISGADSQEVIVDGLGADAGDGRVSQSSNHLGNGLSSSQLKKAAELEEID